MGIYVWSPRRRRAGDNRGNSASVLWRGPVRPVAMGGSSLHRQRNQAGMTLVESLVAVAVLSILLLGIMAAITTTVNVSRSTGQVAATRNALASVVERMSAAGWPGCGTASVLDQRFHDSAHAAFVNAPTGYNFVVRSVSSAQPQQAACSTTPATTAVLVRVEVSHAETGDRADGYVVVRDKSARPT